MMTVFLTIKHESLSLQEGRDLSTKVLLYPFLKSYIFYYRAISVTATLSSAH